MIAVAHRLCVAVFIAFLSACSPTQERETASTPTVRQAIIDGAALDYVEQGRGVPVVFLHGALSDHRAWDLQRAAVAKHYRFVALDQRYFGLTPWQDNGERFSVSTHAEDLAAFLTQLDLGPAHIVGWSYGGTVALILATQHPELVRSLFVYEHSLTTFISDQDTLSALAEERKGLSPAVEAYKTGDSATSVRLMGEWVNNEPGTFDSMSEAARTMFLDNARTLRLFFSAPKPPPVSCEQLAEIRVPVAIVTGENTRNFYRVIAEASSRCIGTARMLKIPGARHVAPLQNSEDFNQVLLGFLRSAS